MATTNQRCNDVVMLRLSTAAADDAAALKLHGRRNWWELFGSKSEQLLRSSTRVLLLVDTRSATCRRAGTEHTAVTETSTRSWSDLSQYAMPVQCDLVYRHHRYAFIRSLRAVPGEMDEFISVKNALLHDIRNVVYECIDVWCVVWSRCSLQAASVVGIVIHSQKKEIS